jgi:uncharacterized protein YqgQ
MGFPPVKQLLHSFGHILRHTLKTGMFQPVLGSVPREREILQAVSGNIFVQVQKNTQTRLGEKGMSVCHGNVVTGNGVVFFGQAVRSQELLDCEVGKLHDFGIPDVDNGNQCGACG